MHTKPDSSLHTDLELSFAVFETKIKGLVFNAKQGSHIGELPKQDTWQKQNDFSLYKETNYCLQLKPQPCEYLVCSYYRMLHHQERGTSES
jgi:hypothetical protein